MGEVKLLAEQVRWARWACWGGGRRGRVADPCRVGVHAHQGGGGFQSWQSLGALMPHDSPASPAAPPCSGPLQVAAAVVQRPNILGLELGGVRRMVGYLAANGKGMDEIAQLLASSL